MGVILITVIAVAYVGLMGCDPRYRRIPPPGHTDTDISLDLAYCQEERRGQFERVEAEACLQGRGWTLEPLP